MPFETAIGRVRKRFTAGGDVVFGRWRRSCKEGDTRLFKVEAPKKAVAVACDPLLAARGIGHPIQKFCNKAIDLPFVFGLTDHCYVQLLGREGALIVGPVGLDPALIPNVLPHAARIEHQRWPIDDFGDWKNRLLVGGKQFAEHNFHAGNSLKPSLVAQKSDCFFDLLFAGRSGMRSVSLPLGGFEHAVRVAAKETLDAIIEDLAPSLEIGLGRRHACKPIGMIFEY